MTQLKGPLLGDVRIKGKRGIDWTMFLSAFKCFVGAGGLSFPRALGDMGVIPFFLTLLVNAILADASLGWLATLASHTDETSSIHCMFRKMFAKGGLPAQVMQVFFSMSCCAGYIAFCHEAICDAFAISSTQGSTVVLVTCGLAGTLLCLTRKAYPDLLVYVYGAGSVAIFAGYCVAFVASMTSKSSAAENVQPAVPWFTSQDLYFQSAGKILLIFCSHYALVACMEDRPTDWKRAGRLAIASGMLINGVFALVVGSLLYPKVHDVVYESFRTSDMAGYAVVAEILVSIDLLCTFPLGAEPGLVALQATGIRSRLLFGAVATAFAAAGFGVVLNLAGATGCLAGAYIFPPIMMTQLATRWSHWMGYWMLVIASLTFAAYTCVDTLREVVPHLM